ncbi:MAG: hypothetical protein ABI572_12155 [Actinomycetota bacterium]
MRDDDERRTLMPVQAEQRLDDPVRACGIERPRWFIRQDDARFVNERPGDRHALTLASRQVIRESVRDGADLQRLQQILATGGLVDAPSEHRLEPDVLGHGEERLQVVGLEYEAKGAPAALGWLIGIALPPDALERVATAIQDSSMPLVVAPTLDVAMRVLQVLGANDDPNSDLQRLGGLSVNPERQEARWGEIVLRLTPQEVRILCALTRPGPRAFDELRDDQGSGRRDTIALRSAVSRLRNKLDRARLPVTIVAIPGYGFELLPGSL